MIWQNYCSDKKFVIAEKISPYFETLNNFEGSKYCEVNPILRFDEIFNCLERQEEYGTYFHGLELLKNEEFELDAENVLFHIFALLDLESGLDEKQIKMNYLDKDIEKGFFSEKLKTLWKNVQSKEKNKILFNLVSKMEDETRENYFFDTLIKMFAQVSIVFEKSTSKYYIYINERKTEYRETLFEVVKLLFWNFQNDYELVWQYHYGIIGNDSVMRIGEIAIV